MAELVRIPDRMTGGWEFEAEWGEEISTRYGEEGQGNREGRPRWGVNAVWKLTDGKGYAVLRASYSLIYHTEPTTCRNAGNEGPGTGPQSGMPAPVDDLPDEAEPCGRCRPPYPEDLPYGATVRYEYPRQTVKVIATPAEVIRQLTQHRKHTGDQVVSVSDPVQALIFKLRQRDPAFAGSQLPMQRIG